MFFSCSFVTIMINLVNTRMMFPEEAETETRWDFTAVVSVFFCMCHLSYEYAIVSFNWIAAINVKYNPPLFYVYIFWAMFFFVVDFIKLHFILTTWWPMTYRYMAGFQVVIQEGCLQLLLDQVGLFPKTSCVNLKW